MTLLRTFVENRLRLPRCAWCDERGSAGDPLVHHQGLAATYHADCGSIAYARTLCRCTGGPWEASLNGMPYGYCLSCGNYRCWVSADELRDPDYPGERVNRMLAGVPQGVRAPEVALMAGVLWAQWRERQEA